MAPVGRKERQRQTVLLAPITSDTSARFSFWNHEFQDCGLAMMHKGLTVSIHPLFDHPGGNRRPGVRGRVEETEVEDAWKRIVHGRNAPPFSGGEISGHLRRKRLPLFYRCRGRAGACTAITCHVCACGLARPRMQCSHTHDLPLKHYYIMHRAARACIMFFRG